MTALLANLTLLSPWMAAGAGLAVLPIVAHLLNRRARRKIVFPTIRLLGESKARTSRLFRLRRLLVLVTRCLIVAMVALAFARPVWFRQKATTASAENGAAVVLLLDTSASMSRQAGGTTLLASATSLADRTLNAVEPGRDRLGLVLASAQPRSALPELTGDVEVIRRELRAVRGTQHRPDLRTALVRAGQLLAQHPGPHKLVVFTDCQQSNWSDVSDEDVSRALPAGTAVTLVPVGEFVRNLSLSRPRCAPARPQADTPVRLSVQVHNYSPDPRKAVVRVTVDGRDAARTDVDLAAWVSTEVDFQHVVGAVGVHEVVFSIDRDDMPADDDAYFAARALPQLKVAVIADDNPDEPGTSSYFLTRALAPNGDGRDPFRPVHLESAAIDLGRIADADAVFLGEVGRLERPGLEALLGYVRRGGGLGVFCGSGPLRENLLALEGLDGQTALLPWRPAEQRALADRGGFLCPVARPWDEAVLPSFAPEDREALCHARVYAVWSADRPNPAAREVLRYSDGTPAVSAVGVEGGKLVLINAGCSLAASDMGKYGTFVAMVQDLANWLRPAHAAGAAPLAGEPLTLALDSQADPQAARLSGPDGQPREAEVLIDGTLRSLHLAVTDLPGFYRLWSDRAVSAEAAVNLDPAESDLRALPPEDLAKVLSAGGAALAVSNAQQADEILEVRGRPLWHVAVLIAMALAGVELVILCIWRQ